MVHFVHALIQFPEDNLGHGALASSFASLVSLWRNFHNSVSPKLNAPHSSSIANTMSRIVCRFLWCRQATKAFLWLHISRHRQKHGVDRRFSQRRCHCWGKPASTDSLEKSMIHVIYFREPSDLFAVLPLILLLSAVCKQTLQRWVQITFNLNVFLCLCLVWMSFWLKMHHSGLTKWTRVKTFYWRPHTIDLSSPYRYLSPHSAITLYVIT